MGGQPELRITSARSDWRVSDCWHQVLGSVLPRYGCVLELRFKDNKHLLQDFAPPGDRTPWEGSWSQAKECQLANSLMPWPGSQV